MTQDYSLLIVLRAFASISSFCCEAIKQLTITAFKAVNSSFPCRSDCCSFHLSLSKESNSLQLLKTKAVQAFSLLQLSVTDLEKAHCTYLAVSLCWLPSSWYLYLSATFCDKYWSENEKKKTPPGNPLILHLASPALPPSPRSEEAELWGKIAQNILRRMLKDQAKQFCGIEFHV